MSTLRQPSAVVPGSTSSSPTLVTSPQFLRPNLPDPSSSSLNRVTSAGSSSQHAAGRIPSSRPTDSNSRKSSFKVLSRQGSLKDKDKQKHGREVSNQSECSDDGFRSPLSESGSADVIETGAVRVQKDHGSGRWMINQYRVLREIGHGTHGRVRLGEDLSAQLPIDEGGDVGLGISQGGPFYAIKIVDRNPKKKRLTGLGRQKGTKSGRDGAKMLNESEIRKEIAIFKKVNHPNVVRMKEIIDDPESSKIYMIMEWCKNGEIRWKEAEGSPALTVGETRKIFRDTLLGLEYLHHQGIIHRDIKPSNLLRAADNTVKISDFGCSHFSEALRAAAAQPGPEGDAYVDDIELAKTAGSPAFFAPEMCYSGLDTDISQRSTSSPQSTPMTEVPSFTLRPPSSIETRSSQSDPSNLGSSIPLRPTLSNESAFSRRPPSARSHSSSATIHRRERLPITNAIDVWALGVTLYCLFFGKTPFDAPNEYLLMQVIPVQDYVVPPFVGKDHIPTGTGGLPASEEANEGLDLLRKLLEKDPAKRITLEQAKKHPFTLRGISDPTSWLAKTDPHTQTFVTVSNDEVAAVITKSTGFRDRFRKGIKSISHKLQLLSGSNRTRSRSIGETDSPGEPHPPTSSHLGTPRSSKLLGLVPSSRDVSPMTSPLPAPPGLSRRLSLLGSKLLPGESPQPQGASPNVSGHTSPESSSEVPNRTPSVSSIQSAPGRSFMDQRRPSTHLIPPAPSTMVPLAADDTPKSPRPVASSSSLDKVKNASDISPNSSLRRRGSGDIDTINKEMGYRPRTHSNASSISSKLARLLSRTGSQRSRRLQDKDRELLAASDVEETGVTPSAASSSPADALGRMSLDEIPRRSLETFESGSYSSQQRAFAPSPERGIGMWNWDNRLRAAPLRRGSNLSEEYTPTKAAGRDVVDEEEVDWNGAISDDEEEDYGDETNNDHNNNDNLDNYTTTNTTGTTTSSSSRMNFNHSTLTPSAPNLPSNWRKTTRDGLLGLDIPQLPPIATTTSSQPVPVAAPPTLDPIPDGSPSTSISSSSKQPTSSTSTTSTSASASGSGSGSGSINSNPINITNDTSTNSINNQLPLQRTSSRNSTHSSSRISQSHSPFRSSFLHERAKSPLGLHTHADSPKRLSRQTSASVFDLQDDEDDGNGDGVDDNGLAITIGGRRERGRKNSMLSNR
ncbi:CAMKK/ELM protein kinase [Kwoniella mangroviensis CBS 10435]|uniref:CAMKK/ELM protein kinase n=1 Tax=Kwoniella mangroviensis CBS 10435 TaxID=1331196 RepID=A0A1B9IJ47_9TREE|nr:CAMKK/ELM protein kinase [Kwoniella mangroviensis CBS 10435]